MEFHTKIAAKLQFRQQIVFVLLKFQFYLKIKCYHSIVSQFYITRSRYDQIRFYPHRLRCSHNRSRMIRQGFTATLLVAMLLLGTGCVSAKNATAGEIGCKPDDIIISESRTATLTDYWQATCANKRYECSGSGNVFVGYQAKCKESMQ